MYIDRNTNLSLTVTAIVLVRHTSRKDHGQDRLHTEWNYHPCAYKCNNALLGHVLLKLWKVKAITPHVVTGE